jgi:hypothetical protein
VTEDQAEEMLDLLKDILVRLGAGATSQSSVEIKSSTRGLDVTVKGYVGSDLAEIGDTVLDEYFRLLAEAQLRITGTPE